MLLCSICLPHENRDVTALHLQFCLFTYIHRGIDFSLNKENKHFSLFKFCSAMKNKKDQKNDRSPQNQHPKNQREPQGDMPNGQEGGRGANKNDDRSEDSKGGGNHGLGNQEGANQGNYQGNIRRH